MKILVAASGTGGHLFPARYIIEAFQERGVEVAFVGAGKELEEKIIAPLGLRHYRVRTVGLKNRGLRGGFEFLWSFPRAWRETRQIFSEVRPDAVVGVGGYVTFLPVTLAWIKRIPRWIHEAELRPGMANFVLSFYANMVSTAFSETKMPGFARQVHTGHPVRRELSRAAAEKQFPDQPKRLLILGGSQGARALDLAMIALAPFLAERGVSVWHQCREENSEAVIRAYQEHGIEARVVSFIEELSDAFSWSDLILSRSGAGAVSEIAVMGVPTVFVPYPFAQGDHQAANARTLVERGKALMVREGDEFESRLREALEQLLTPATYRSMVDAPPLTKAHSAAATIAAGVVDLVSNSKK